MIRPFTKNNLRRVVYASLFFAFVASPSITSSKPRPGQDDVYISIHFRNASLRQVLGEIGKKSGLSITYTDADLPKAATVTYERENVSVAEALNQVLKGTGLTHREFRGIIIIFKTPPATRAEKGSIEGNISDAETGEMLVGANVRVVGTMLGNNADVNGHYIIKDVPAGIYELAISFIGYETSIVRDVHVKEGNVTQADHKLKPSRTELQSVEVIGNAALTGNVVETNESSLVNSIKSSRLIISGISAQQIARSIDQDAGEVARRMPGVTVLNNFVNIRGMHERYNLTILNDMIAPSSESDRRAFSYDLLPSNMIDKMTVYRSPSPELLADWAGGVIKIETKSTSIARQIEVNLSGWVRGGTTFKDMYANEGGQRDWIGMDDGSRALPNGFPALNQIPGAGKGQVNTDRTRNLGAISAGERAQNAQLGKAMMSNWNLKREEAPIDYRAGINYYDSWRLGKMRLNNLTSINTTQSNQVINQKFNPLVRVNSENGVEEKVRTYNDTIGRKSARWGLLQNLKLRITPSHSIELKGVFNQLGTDETYVRKGFNYIGDFDLGYVTKVFYTYRSRSILGTQLAGVHTFGRKKDHQLNWSGGYSTSNEDVPGQRMLYLKNNTSPENEQSERYITTGTNLGAFSIANAWNYSASKEKNLTAFLDYEKKFGKEFAVKVGFFDEKKTRTIDGRLVSIGTDPNPPSSSYLLNNEGQPVDQWRAEEVLRPDRFLEEGGGLFIYDNNYLSGQYSFDGNIIAGYAAINIPILPEKLSIYGGMRFEKQALNMVIAQGGGLDSVGIDRTKSYWLPSVNLKYSITPSLIFRASFGKTINRPNYREMTPIYVNDPKLEILQYGNSNLQDATIDNYDARMEWYFSDSEFVSAGLFYKNITNAIEPYIESGGKSEELYFSNTEKAKVKGLEVEVRKSFASIPVRWAKYFSTIANFALLKSEVKFVDSLYRDAPGDFSTFQTKTRQLEGTAKYVVNAGLYFEHPEWGMKIAALYNVLGQRLIYAGTYFFPETYELPRHVIDLTFRQRLTKQLELRAGVQDILNQPRRLYRDFSRDQHYKPDLWNKLPYKDYMMQEYKPGRYYTLGINLTL